MVSLEFKILAEVVAYNAKLVSHTTKFVAQKKIKFTIHNVEIMACNV